MWTLFFVSSAPLALTVGGRGELLADLAGIAGVRTARVMVPDMSAVVPGFAEDGRGPELALQLSFEDRSAADAVLAHWTPPRALGSATDCVGHQLMRGRRFPTPAPGAIEPSTTLLVTYPGPALNEDQWLDHYDAHHPPIMVRFPRIREVETYRPVSWTSALPFRRDAVLQRNKVVFDTLADLVAALASPVMIDMRADTAKFPPFSGRTTHFAMTTWTIEGRAG